MNSFLCNYSITQISLVNYAPLRFLMAKSSRFSSNRFWGWLLKKVPINDVNCDFFWQFPSFSNICIGNMEKACPGHLFSWIFLDVYFATDWKMIMLLQDVNKVKVIEFIWAINPDLIVIPVMIIYLEMGTLIFLLYHVAVPCYLPYMEFHFSIRINYLYMWLLYTLYLDVDGHKL